MHDSPPEINPVFAMFPTDAAAAKISPARRQLNAVASLFAYFDGEGKRQTSLTPRGLAHVTGCKLRAAQLTLKSHRDAIDLTIPATQFTTLVATDAIWKLNPSNFVVAAVIKRLAEMNALKTGSHAIDYTDATISDMTGIPVWGVARSVAYLKSVGLIDVATSTARHSVLAGFTRCRVITPNSAKNVEYTNSVTNPAGTNSAKNAQYTNSGVTPSAIFVGKSAISVEASAIFVGKSAISVEKSAKNAQYTIDPKVPTVFPTASSSREPKPVAAAGVIAITNEPGSQSPSPLKLTHPDIWDALSRFDKTTGDQIAGLVADHLRANDDDHPTISAWLVELLSDALAARNPAGFVRSTMPARWAERQTPLPPAQPKRILSKDGKRVCINGEWVDAAQPPVNAPQAGDDTLAQRRREREAHEARFDQLEMRRSWPTVPAALAARLDLGYESGRRGFGQLVKIDGTWRMSPAIVAEIAAEYPDASQTYSEQPERRAALNGTDTNPATDRNAEAFTVETVTGTPGIEAPQPVPAPAGGSTPDAVVDTRTSLPTAQGRGAVVATQPSAKPYSRLKSKGDGSSLPEDRFAKLRAAINEQQKSVG